MTKGTRGTRELERRSRTSSSVTALTLFAIGVPGAHAPPLDLVRLAPRHVHSAARARDHVLARGACGCVFRRWLLHLRAEDAAKHEVDEECDEEQEKDAGHGAI